MTHTEPTRHPTTLLVLLLLASFLLSGCGREGAQEKEKRGEQGGKAGDHGHHQEPGTVKVTEEAQKAAG